MGYKFYHILYIYKIKEVHCHYNYSLKMQINISIFLKQILTVSFGSIFQTESDGEHGVILEKLCGERIPPEIVTVLGGNKENHYSQFFIP